MNMIDCTVEAVDAEGVTVRDAAGSVHRAAVDGRHLANGEAVTLGIRPEHLTIAASGETAMTVQAIEQLGGESYLYCQTADGTKLTAHLAGQTGMRRGQDAFVSILPGHAHLFAGEAGTACQRLLVAEAVHHFDGSHDGRT